MAPAQIMHQEANAKAKATPAFRDDLVKIQGCLEAAQEPFVPELPAEYLQVGIQLLGAMGVGKTALLGFLIKEYDPAKLSTFISDMSNVTAHHHIQVGDRQIDIRDYRDYSDSSCLLVMECFRRSEFAVVIYDMSSQATLDYAMELIKVVRAAGTKVVLFGNTYNVEQGKPVEVDVTTAKDFALRNDGMALESSNLIDAVQMIIDSLVARESKADVGGAMETSPSDNSKLGGRKSIAATVTDTVRNLFDGAGDREQARSANQKVLRPSVKATKTMQKNLTQTDADLKPVQKLQVRCGAIMCICFGQERHHKAYILLAVGDKDGVVFVYRLYRTKMEIEALMGQDFPPEENGALDSPPADDSNIVVHNQLVGHSGAITSMFFTCREDELVTTSFDKSVRFWDVDSGVMLKVFPESSAVAVAAQLPSNPQVFVLANNAGRLRLCDLRGGRTLQTLNVKKLVKALTFDDIGQNLVAGAKDGRIDVLEASDSNSLKFKLDLQLPGRGDVSCVKFVSAASGQPPCLLVNASDKSVTIIDCTYEETVLTHLAIRRIVSVMHSFLPLQCCYSPNDQGYLISGSEDAKVYIYSLDKTSHYKAQLKCHEKPVVTVAVNLQTTLLVSADSLGRIVLWRSAECSE